MSRRVSCLQRKTGMRLIGFFLTILWFSLQAAIALDFSKFGKELLESIESMVEKKAATHAERELAEKELAKRALAKSELNALIRKKNLEIFKDIDGSPPRTSVISVEDEDVKRFSEGFRAGKRNPEKYLKEVSAKCKPLVEAWLNTPPEKRLFIVASGLDVGAVLELRSACEKEGYGVFFYVFCGEQSGELCTNETVGAFSGTAGRRLIADTQASECSRFVAHEIGASQGNWSIIIVQSDLQAAAGKQLKAGLIRLSLTGNQQSQSH